MCFHSRVQEPPLPLLLMIYSSIGLSSKTLQGTLQPIKMKTVLPLAWAPKPSGVKFVSAIQLYNSTNHDQNPPIFIDMIRNNTECNPACQGLMLPTPQFTCQIGLLLVAYGGTDTFDRKIFAERKERKVVNR